ncbi:hypothetical protein D4R08_11905 [Corynebacterium xerosis]|nr:hypothetical protein D4R08_11905 [Corynebacterium xerosis]
MIGPAGADREPPPAPRACDAGDDGGAAGSRFSARWRIVTWVMVLLGIMLFPIILTTRRRGGRSTADEPV